MKTDEIATINGAYESTSFSLIYIIYILVLITRYLSCLGQTERVHHCAAIRPTMTIFKNQDMSDKIYN